MYRKVLSFIWLFALLVSTVPTLARQDTRQVVVLTANGPLTAPMVQYIKRGLEQADRQDAHALVLQLNTPGGSLSLMNMIIEALRGSRVPVIVYVSPNGGMAASAGALITLAGHAAAMAPETSIGAASPVGPEGEDLGETIAAKEKNILKATVSSLTERRGEQATRLAEAMIESAEAVSARQALQVGLIDFIATDLDDLLRQLDGMRLQTSTGEVVLQTSSVVILPIELTFIEELLGILTNPNIVFLLLTIGVQAILIEISSPGGWIAGFIGSVCLALAGYGLGVLPVNWFGIIFLVIAFILFILDIKAPTHGGLTTAGVISFIVGALVLFNSPRVPSFQRVSVPLVISTSVIVGLTFFIILMIALRIRKAAVRTGAESLAGRIGTVRIRLNPGGQVQLGGEQWSAELEPGQEPLAAGVRVRVVRVEGLRLIVRKSE